MKKLNKKGFTIVELVIVIAVIAILAAVLIPTFSGVIKSANESAAMQACSAAFTEALTEVYKSGTAQSMDTTAVNGFVFTITAENGVVKTATVKTANSKYPTTSYSYSYANGSWTVTSTK